ncbi:MAG: hypothetical protein H6867_10805 [Rhodospirillales bacterium]|nr:hypothetical protein [Rhodospirillales bacterium]MCB9995730.1 hypothetical protein [Rhodospirillales bacterium]
MTNDDRYIEKTPAHFNQERKRKAEYIKPPNTLKAKVGSGGLSEQILQKAQALLENNSVDFQPLAEMYLSSLMRGIEIATDPNTESDTESLISGMLYPSMQLKANGGMFHYPLVTNIADRLVQFLEVIEEPDIDAVEIVLAFHTTIRAVIIGKITGTGGRHGDELMGALNEACTRYFERYPENKTKTPQEYGVEF